MCCLSCCDKFFNNINRFFNLLIALVGLALVGFGVFLTSKSAWQPTNFCIGLFAAGGFVCLTALSFLTCGHRSICCVSAYIYAMVLLILAVFGWAVNSGQLEDLSREGERILLDEDQGP